MGNMFFSIGQMTDFLLSDAVPGNQAKSQATTGQVDFEEFVKGLTNQTNQGQLTKGITGDLANYLKQANTKNQTGGVSESNDLAITDSLVDSFNMDELLSLVSQSLDNTAKSIPLSQYDTPTDPALAAEVYDVVELEVSDIKGYLSELKQPVKATVSLKDIQADLSLQQLIKLSEPIATDNQISDGRAIAESAGKPGYQSAPEIKPAEAILSLKELATNFDMIELDTRQLFKSSDKTIDITAFNEKGNKQDLTVKTDEVKALISSKDQSPVIEIPTNKAQINNFSNTISGDTKLADIDKAQSPGEDKVIVDLKTLVSAKETDEIKVVLKSMDNATEKLSSVGLLNEFKQSGKDNIKLKLTNSSKEVKVNELTKPDQSVKVAAESSSNDNHTDNSSEKKNQYNQNTGFKPLTNIQNQVTGQAIALNKETGSVDLVSTQQAGIKDVSQTASVDNKTELYSVNDNKELIESITNQVKAKISSGSAGTRLTVNLKPEYLGKIDIEFTFDKNKLEAIFRVEKNEIRAILDSELPKLKQEFKIDSYRVETNPQSFHDDSQAHNGRNQFERMAGQNNPYRNGNSSGGGLSDKTQINEITNNTKNVRTGYGHGKNIDLLA